MNIKARKWLQDRWGGGGGGEETLVAKVRFPIVRSRNV